MYFVCEYVQINIYICVYILSMCICMYVCICECVYMYMSIYVYICICMCMHVCIGETGRQLAVRITEHIRSVRNNISGFPVAQHFNPPSHCSFNYFSVTGIIHCNCSNVNRLNIESRIILS